MSKKKKKGKKKHKNRPFQNASKNMTHFNNITTLLFLDFSFNILMVMTEILDTVHP
jgi:hypothetical protein